MESAITMNLSKTIGLVTVVNEFANFYQVASSFISYVLCRFSGTQTQKAELLHLQSGLECLKDILPAMDDLINRAEWKIHEERVAEVFANLKDAVYDAHDLLDEFSWYKLKVEIESDATENPFIGFYDSVIQGSFNKVNKIHERLNNITSQLEKMGLRALEGIQRFDKSVRPETSSFPNETKIFGRDKELKKLMGLLGVPANSSRAHSKRKRGSSAVNASTSTSSSNQENNESRMPVVPVLPIVGIGGVGKTTLAQHICNHPQVKSHFDMILWTCVSDDFDVTRLTKEALQSSPGKEATTDHLESLQRGLSDKVRNKKFLIVLDDMWDDALKENGECWKRFCAPLKNILPGSMMLVTTRCQLVADGVRTMESFTLDGLKDDVFSNFFKLCVFGSQGSNDHPELELIGRRILQKLKGSPLGAKTLGRLLRQNLQATHWKKILESELWELKQDETDILPALRLSYIYLPYHLKKCFSFCAVYPKDHRFEQGSLAEIWVAEGFVEHEGDTPIMDIASRYFEDLVNRSFFQKVGGVYLIHDLMHDMAQLVSKHDCFIIKDNSDFKKIPETVRHLSIFPTTNIDHGKLSSLCKHTKLRTLLCRSLRIKNALASAMDRWCSELQHLRVILFATAKELPESIGNLKHLRYLKISGACPFKSLPSKFCCLYNLQIFSAEKCRLESLPSGFFKLTNLQRFEIRDFSYSPNCSLCIWEGQQLALITNMNQFYGDLKITCLDSVTKDHAAEAELNKKKSIRSLTLEWCNWISQENNMIEVLHALRPSSSLKSLTLKDYPGESLPSWFQPQDLPSLTSIKFSGCSGLKSMAEFSTNNIVENNNGCIGCFSSLTGLTIYDCGNLSSIDSFLKPAYVPAIKRISISCCKNLVSLSTGCIGCFSSLTGLTIYDCDNLSSIDSFLKPAYVPAIKRISISCCKNLVSLSTERVVEFRCLEELTVVFCKSIYNPFNLSAPTLKKLELRHSGNLAENIASCSITSWTFSSELVQSILLHLLSTNLPYLQELVLSDCASLEFIGESESTVSTNLSLCLQESQGRSNRRSSRKFSSLTNLTVQDCDRLSNLDGLLSHKYLPAIKRIFIQNCEGLRSLPGKVFGSFSFLKDLEIRNCPSLNWQRGLVLPSSLLQLSLTGCGDMSGCFPTCLENLSSLVSLQIRQCSGVVSFPGHLWASNLTSLQELDIVNCPDLVSIGGAKAIAKVKRVTIRDCTKLKKIKQPVWRSWI